MTVTRASLTAVASALALALAAGPSLAAKHYGPGVTDKEIKIGNTMPYSGNASAYGVDGKAEAAYFHMIDDQGGVNGRKIDFVSLDDGYSPPKTVELTRQLVERDRVLLMFSALGTPTNTAVHQYLNKRKVPQLFVASGASKWNDPKKFPWSMGFAPSYHTEGKIYAKHVLQTVKDPKIAVLMQNDDYGKDYYNGFREGLGKQADKLIAQLATYEVTDATVDSQIIQLKNTGANVLFIIATPKFAAQAIKKVGEIGWKPAEYLNNVSASIGSVIKPAGFDNAQGIITAKYRKDPTDPQWADAPDYKAWKAWMAKYNPDGNVADLGYVTGYVEAFTMVQVLKQCGDDLTRENVMKQAANLHDLEVPMLLPGIQVNTGPDDFAPVETVQLAHFKGQNWELFGQPISADKD